MIYKIFKGNLPTYLVRYYWWAYLWRASVWFFDHQPIINAILFGQYKRLMDHTLKVLASTPQNKVLQLSCVYGNLSPKISNLIRPNKLHITDVAPIQLRLVIGKIKNHSLLIPTRMNAEQLGYRCNYFSAVVIFFLLHELPTDARARVLAESIRVLSSGGRLIITEYGYCPTQHFLYRFPISRFLLKKSEPFLADFWTENIEESLITYGCRLGKTVRLRSITTFFSGFYRVLEFEICEFR